MKISRYKNMSKSCKALGKKIVNKIIAMETGKQMFAKKICNCGILYYINIYRSF